MDYVALRNFLAKKIMDITLEWNQKEGAYPVRPEGLTEAQGKMWDLFVHNSKLSSISETQTAIIREGLEDLIGRKFPDTSNRNLTDIPPYVCLTAVRGGLIHGVDEGRPVLKKMSGPWLDETAVTRTLDPMPSQYVRLPSPEDVEAVICTIPDTRLAVVFYGLLNLKNTEKSLKGLLSQIKKVNKDLFKNAPAKLEMTDKELRMYTYAHHNNVSSSIAHMIFMSADLEHDPHKSDLVRDYESSVPSISPLTCVRYKGTPVLFVSSKALYESGTFKVLDNAPSWSDLAEMTAEEVKNTLTAIPAGGLFDWISEEEQVKMLEEVKLE